HTRFSRDWSSDVALPICLGLRLLGLSLGLLLQGLEAFGAPGLLGLAGLLQAVVTNDRACEFLAEADELVAQAANMVELQVADPHDASPIPSRLLRTLYVPEGHDAQTGASRPLAAVGRADHEHRAGRV